MQGITYMLGGALCFFFCFKKTVSKRNAGKHNENPFKK